MSSKVRVNVTPEMGESITLTSSGETHTYKVTDGHVSVERDQLEKFLSAVPGSAEAKSGAGTSGDESKGENL